MDNDTKGIRKNYLNREIVSSVHINFLFGAGVNGCVFPQLNGFTKTLTKINEYIGKYEDKNDLGFEERIDLLEGEERETVKKAFIEEFKEFQNSVDPFNASLKNLGDLLSKVAQIVEAAQNRTQSMNQINIYTLNYDYLVEDVLQKRGLFHNSISSSNVSKSAKLMNVLGYDYSTKKYLPSFLISKLHGDISSPIIPGKNKYREVLNENYFEIVFNMKEHLCKANSILIVIGYSGNDKHINKILEDCVATGLVIYWYKYNKDETLISAPEHHLFIQDQKDYSNKQDSTRICYEDLCEIWEEKLAE